MTEDFLKNKLNPYIEKYRQKIGNSDIYSQKVVDVYIAEFNTLRAEVITRLQVQNQAFNFLLIVLAAAFTAAFSNLDHPQTIPLIIFNLLLFLPIITGPLGLIFFDNEMAIHAIGSHIYYILRPQINNLLDGQDYMFRYTLEFPRLNKHSRFIHRHISWGRWLLFILPSILPIIAIFIYTLNKGLGWWASYFDITQISLTLINIFYSFIFFVDIVVSVILLEAIYWAAQKQKNLA